MGKKAYVICCNDSIEYVVLDSREKAETKKESLATEEYGRWKENNYGRANTSDESSYASYRKRFYWHLHEVDA